MDQVSLIWQMDGKWTVKTRTVINKNRCWGNLHSLKDTNKHAIKERITNIPEERIKDAFINIFLSMFRHLLRLGYSAEEMAAVIYFHSNGYKPIQPGLQKMSTASLQMGKRTPRPLSVLDMKLNYLMVKLQFWSFEECGLTLHCYWSILVHYDPEW